MRSVPDAGRAYYEAVDTRLGQAQLKLSCGWADSLRRKWLAYELTSKVET